MREPGTIPQVPHLRFGLSYIGLLAYWHFRTAFSQPPNDRPMCVSIVRSLTLVSVLATSVIVSCAAHADDVWQSFETRTQAGLRGLAAVNKDVAWACGSKGTIVQTIDGGTSWFHHAIPNLQDVEIRSIHAWDRDQAIVATAGQPALILKTTDRGVTWVTKYENKSPQAFFDGMKFRNDRSGLAFSDPVDGSLLIVRTDDGGDSWKAIEPAAIPAMDHGEAGFAASNSSLHLFGDDFAWIGLGGGSDGPSRLFRSQDGGLRWTSQIVQPIARGTSSGIFSIAFESEFKGVAVGGDYNKTTVDNQNVAITVDTGKSWRAPRGNRPRGFRSCVIAIEKTWLTCGPSGCDWSLDGEDWFAMSDIGFHVIAVASDGSIWGSGSGGRIARMTDASRRQFTIRGQ